MNQASRPSPDALLKAARRAARGRLKIFIGAAPGVGKTYEMLLHGADLLRDGKDVIVGLVETHGRAETQALVAPFEIVPRQTFDHGGHRLEEFDLDALLARRPEVALVDELAHTNAPGCRHAKRWQDIEELRDAGIDILTTLNIQHVESLNDVVASFTRVRVRETVPDGLLDEADIEVVDLPPDELIARLREGKVYGPGEGQRALDAFFTKSNLSGLRELALRRAAQAVDRQMLDHVDATGEPGTFAAGERVMVALGPHDGASALVRAGKRLADAFHAPWSAVTVETPATVKGDKGERDLSEALTLAARLGATLATIPAMSVPQGLRGYAQDTRATVLVLGQSRRGWWQRSRRGSLTDFMARTLPAVTLHVLPQSNQPIAARHVPDHPWQGTLPGLLLTALATGINLGVAAWIGNNPVDLIYLIPVIATATLWGLRPALVTSFAAALAYNFFFLPPIHTVTIADPRNAVTFVLLAAVGVIASQMAGRLRRAADLGARTASENAAIAAFGQRLAAVTTEVETAQVTCQDVAALMGCSTLVMTSGENGPRLIWSVPGDPALTPLDLAAAGFALQRGEVAGRASATLNAAEWQFHPLRTAHGVLGLLGICNASGGNPVLPGRQVLFQTLLGQAALAHERLRLERGDGTSAPRRQDPHTAVDLPGKLAQ